MAKKTENAIRVIVEAAKNYEKYLNNRKFLIIRKLTNSTNKVLVIYSKKQAEIVYKDTRSEN